MNEHSKSHPETCSRELARQEAQKDENAGEGDDCCTGSNDSATLVRVQVRARWGQVGGHDCIRSEGFGGAVEYGSACARIERRRVAWWRREKCTGTTASK